MRPWLLVVFQSVLFERQGPSETRVRPMFENRALTPAEVARRLQVSEDRVLRWLSAGQLRGLRLDDEWRTSTLSVAAFLEARANRPTPGSLATGDNARLYTFLRREG